MNSIFSESFKRYSCLMTVRAATTPAEPLASEAGEESNLQEERPENRSLAKIFQRLKQGYDKPDVTLNPYARTLYSAPADETGWDRIKAMYTVNEYGSLGPEWSMIINSFWAGLVCGGMFGALSGGRASAMSFVDRNQGTLFQNEMDAKRTLQDKITFGMGRGALKWGLKLGSFTGIYVFAISTLSVYKNRTSLVDYTAAGAITGALFRFLRGPKATISGSVVGGVLGLFAGGCSMTVLHFVGISFEEIRYWHYYAGVKREQQNAVKVAERRRGNDAEDKLGNFHDRIVQYRQPLENPEKSPLEELGGSE